MGACEYDPCVDGYKKKQCEFAFCENDDAINDANTSDDSIDALGQADWILAIVVANIMGAVAGCGGHARFEGFDGVSCRHLGDAIVGLCGQ